MAHETTETAVRVDVPPYTRRQMKTCRPSFFRGEPAASFTACLQCPHDHRQSSSGVSACDISWHRVVVPCERNASFRMGFVQATRPAPHRRHADEDIAVRHACPPLAERADSGVIMRTPVMSERRCQHGATGCSHCRHTRTQRLYGRCPPPLGARPAVSVRRGLDTLLENAPITPCLLSGDTSENIGLSGFFAFAVSAWTAAMPSSCVGNGGRPCIIAWTGRHGRVR